MAKRLGVVLLALASLGACSQAAASPVDPANDLHCSVVAFYFSGHPVTKAAPQDQQVAVKRVFDWYSIKVRALAAESGGDSVLSTAAPVLEAVKKDHLAHREHLLACANRASDDPAFRAWLRGR